MRSTWLSLVLLLGLAACGGAGDEAPGRESTPTDPVDSSTATVDELEEGPVAPGRYRFTIRNVCEQGDLVGCPEGVLPPPPLDLEVTVPAGWQHWWEFGLLTPQGDSTPTEGPDGAALVMGWTTFQVGLNSDPCLAVAHEVPDVKVGPTVDDFVEAVQAHEALDVTEPVEAAVGGFPARFFSLEAPSDLSGCDNWRPWDPGFYAQGPSNRWDVWVVDVDGDRVLVVNQYFPGTPPKVVDELGEMVESLRFHP